MKLLRVCVIGAGGAGLAIARHLTSQVDIFNVSVFEQASSLGGTWVFNEDTGTDERGLPIYSSMYRNLRTNLPKEVMAFPDFPFPSEWRSFISHQQVLKYLEDYASHFNLYKYISFDSTITSVHPITNEDSHNPQWEVVITNANTKESKSCIFEAVVVCSGHFFDPLIPSIPGLEYFGGLVMHSHDYRDPHPFQGKHVVVLGASSSGQDISLEIAKMAERVYLSHKGHLSCKLPDNVEECRPMSCVSSDGVVHFDDGEQKEVDAILFCTGYNFSFPFLQSDCGVEVSDNRVTPLYKHVFSTKYRTLSFVGLCLRICPFPVFSFQAQFIAAVLSGKAKLPSEEEMNAEEEQEFKEKLASGLRKKYAHFLGEKQWDYMRCLAQLTGVQPPSEACENLYKFISKRRKEFLMDYKNDEYEFTSNGKWKKKIDM